MRTSEGNQLDTENEEEYELPADNLATKVLKEINEFLDILRETLWKFYQTVITEDDFRALQ